jgi:DNA polymerase sigma
MKKILFLSIIAILLYSCKSVKYIPVETTKINYRDNLVRDSVIHYDSVYVKDKGDTLILERYKYLYKNRIVKDSVFVNDTIRIPYPVEVVKQIKTPLSSFQNFQILCGRLVLFALLFVAIYFVWKLK